MDMELLNAIAEMIDKKLDERFEKNNEILQQEMRHIVKEDHDRLFNQFSALIEEKVSKEIKVIAEGHSILLDRINNCASSDEHKEVESDLHTLYKNVQKHTDRIKKLESAVHLQEKEIKELKKAN